MHEKVESGVHTDLESQGMSWIVIIGNAWKCQRKCLYWEKSGKTAFSHFIRESREKLCQGKLFFQEIPTLGSLFGRESQGKRCNRDCQGNLFIRKVRNNDSQGNTCQEKSRETVLAGKIIENLLSGKVKKKNYHEISC